MTVSELAALVGGQLASGADGSAKISGAAALGMKWVSYSPGNLARGVPDASAIIILNDPDTGLPAAILAGMGITLARTAAGAAVAARHLARQQERPRLAAGRRRGRAIRGVAGA